MKYPIHSMISNSPLDEKFIEKFSEAVIGFASKETEALMKFAAGIHVLRQIYSRVKIEITSILEKELFSTQQISPMKKREIFDILILLFMETSQKKVVSPYIIAFESLLFPQKFEKIDFENVFVLSFEKLKKFLKEKEIALSSAQIISIIQTAIQNTISFDEHRDQTPIFDPLKFKYSKQAGISTSVGAIHHIEQVRELFHQVKNAYLLLVNVKVIHRDAFDLNDVFVEKEIPSQINPFQTVLPLLKNKLFQIKDLVLEGKFPLFHQSGSLYQLLRSYEFATEQYTRCAEVLSLALIQKKAVIAEFFQKLSLQEISQPSDLSDEILWNDIQIMNDQHYTREDILHRQVSFFERIISHLQQIISKEFSLLKQTNSKSLFQQTFDEHILSFSDAYDLGISAGEITLRKLRETAFIRSQLLKKTCMVLPLSEMNILKQMNNDFHEVGPKNTKDISRSPWSEVITHIENELYCDNSIYIPLSFELQASILRELWNICDENNANPSSQKVLNSIIRGCLNHENRTSSIHSVFAQTGS